MNSYQKITTSINIEELQKHGFIEQDNTYTKELKLQNNFTAHIKLIEDDLYVKVYDSDNEEYLPFNIKNSSSKIVNSLKDELDKIIDSIFYNKDNQILIKVLKYVEEKYNTIPKTPFKDDLVSKTLTVNNKWYAITMRIPANKIGINSQKYINIINLKNKEEKINSLIDNKKYFKAYHMNKKYWFTINLNEEVDFEKIRELIDQSYNLVARNK